MLRVSEKVIARYFFFVFFQLITNGVGAKFRVDVIQGWTEFLEYRILVDLGQHSRLWCQLQHVIRLHIVYRLHQMHELQTIATNVCGVCQSVSQSVSLSV